MELPENKLAYFIQGSEKAKAKWRPVNNHNINNFTEDEIKRITNNYSTPIGRGSFGEVFKGVLDDGAQVAVKKYICQNLKEEFAKEITVHCQINHKNVIRLLGYCSEENALVMVTEYISSGNLKDVLHGSKVAISLDARLCIAIECAEALACMHSMYQPIIHGDIKPDNILLDGKLGAKLSDFGISRLLCSMDSTQYTMHIIGSRGYMDPEHIETGRVDPKNDVYSFGVVLIELVTRAKASENGISTDLTRNFTKALEKRKKAREMFDAEIANMSNMKALDKIAKLAADCLKKDIKRRPEMKDVAERLRALRKVHCQQGEGKTGQWSVWRTQGRRTEKVSIEGPSISSSDSTVVIPKSDSLDIYYATSISSSDSTVVIPKSDSLDIYYATSISSSDSTVVIPKSDSLDIYYANAGRHFERDLRPLRERINNLRIFAEHELVRITNNYSDVIGKGSFGKFYRGTLEDNTLVAVKTHMMVDGMRNEMFATDAITHSHISHNNIIKLLGCCLDVDVLVYEFAANGSLQDILCGNYKLSLGLRLDIAIGCVEALAYLHCEELAYLYSVTHMDILHGNVESANILLDDNFVPKVSELLFPTHAYDSYFVAYDDPAFVQTGLLTPKTDVYNIGIVLLELMTRKMARTRYGDNRCLQEEFMDVYEKGQGETALFDKEILVEEQNTSILEAIAWLVMDCVKPDARFRPEMIDVAERLRQLRRALKPTASDWSSAPNLGS